MKKRVYITVFLLLMVLTVPAQALKQHIVVLPSLSFTGETATCKVIIGVESTKDNISAKVELWQGSSFVESWTVSSTGTLIFEETAQVTKGKTYTLTVTYTVNDGSQQSISTSGTCK